jgi:non-ribosomal peptide synthetase component F
MRSGHLCDYLENIAAQFPDRLAAMDPDGSTGIPKGGMLTHRNATRFVNWCSEVFCPTPEDCFSGHAPFRFDLSILDIYGPLKYGASIHLIPAEFGMYPKELADFIAPHGLTVWDSTPAILGTSTNKMDYQALTRSFQPMEQA